MPAKLRIPNNKAFTLIELLIVISIIAIISALLFVSFTQLQKNARDTQRKSDLQTVASVLQRFYSDNSHFPNSTAAGLITYDTSDCGTATLSAQTWGSGNIICGTPSKTYTKQLPKDPTGSKEYCYKIGSTDQNYTLYAQMEGKGNLTAPLPQCNGETYNFAVTSND